MVPAVALNIAVSVLGHASALVASMADAAAPAAAAPAAELTGIAKIMQSPFPMMLAILAVFYFMLFRPQQKKQKEMTDWLKGLKKGDEVVTSGGLIGKITGLTDTTVTLELQEKVRVKVLRSHISGKPPAAAGSQTAAASGPVAEGPPIK